MSTPSLVHSSVMIYILFVLLLLARNSDTNNASSCHHVARNSTDNMLQQGLSEPLREAYRSNNERHFNETLNGLNTFISRRISLKLGECISYFNRVETSEFKIRLVDMKEVHPIIESYNFSIPKVETHCWCDCPGGRDYCNSGKHECQEPCVSFYAYGQSNAGCSIENYGRSQMCCTSELESGVQMTAVNLGKPYFQATFQNEFFQNETFKVISDERTISRALVKPTWYFKYYSTLLNANINSVEEWNVNKVGWYRNNNFNTALLTSKLLGSVHNCGYQNMSFYMDAVHTTLLPSDALNMTQELESEGGYKLLDGQLELTRHSLPELVVFIDQEGVFRVKGFSQFGQQAQSQSVSTRIFFTKISQTNFSTVDLPNWTEYLSPLEWANGITSSLEVIIMLIVVNSGIVAIWLLNKYLSRLIWFIKVVLLGLNVTENALHNSGIP